MEKIHLKEEFVGGNIKMTASEYNRISSFILDEYGIKLPPIKKTMLESRLQKRLRALNVDNFKSYFDHVFKTEAGKIELIQMVNVITTNKTDFFREADHFDVLSNRVLPEFLQEGFKNLKIWSAGCSSGEEPYTLGMVMQEFQDTHPSMHYSIFGTDLSTDVLQKATLAVYNEEKTAPIPMFLKKKYFLKSKDPNNKTLRVVPDLRRKFSFERLNFMDESYAITGPFDIVFCRNVLIYFNKETQENVIRKVISKLRPGGYFFLGHSESISDLELPLVQVKPTVFRKI